MQRRLAAIVAADVVGYSRMIRADEDGTLAALQSARAESIDPAIARHGGRIVKLMGDGVLVEFGSAVDAVSAAVDVQREMSIRNMDTPMERQINLRVGVNLGDVVIDGDDIQGDGVNIAARLEALADPGAICLSDPVHEQVRDRLELTFFDLGAQQLKNIDRPVQAWQWTNGTQTPQPLLEDMPMDLPEKPSVAVLPFDNKSGDPEQEYFADGISEDVITALSRNRDLFVIARSSSFAYRGKFADIRLIGKDLGVEYVLEGSLRHSGTRIRVTAQLIEAETGSHVWAEKYDRPVDDIFEVQDEITMNVAGAVGSEIRAADIKRVAHRDTKDLKSWERLMKAYWHILRTNTEDLQKGQEICRAEIAGNSVNAPFHSLLVMACGFEVNWKLSHRTPEEIIDEGMLAARAAITQDPSDENAHANLCGLLFICGEHDAALREGEAAIALNPNSVAALLWSGCVLAYSGTEFFDAAMDLLNKSIRLGPRDVTVHWTYAHMAVASLHKGKFDDAMNYARASIRHDPTNGTAYRLLTASLAHSGQIDAARDAWATTLEVSPLELGDWERMAKRVHKNSKDFEYLKRGLQLAGASF